MTADRDLTIDQAAALLGLSREGVRSRLRRGLLQGERRGKTWVVFAPAAEPSGGGQPVTVKTLDRADRRDRPDRADRVRRRDVLVARLEADVAFLQAELERRDRELEQAAVERAELRRLLAAEQQRRLPVPMDTTAAELPVEHTAPAENPPVAEVSAGVPPTDLAQALKDAGVKKKQRRQLLKRLAGAWRR